jgi:hypothetical protein
MRNIFKPFPFTKLKKAIHASADAVQKNPSVLL